MSYSSSFRVDTRSTLSAPVKNEIHNNHDVPDFTEFKLEAFKMNTTPDITPAPHKLRETRRAFTLYLEPNPDTPIQASLQRYQESTLLHFGPNQAHNTKPHISILNRVLIERHGSSIPWNTIVDEFIQVLDQEITKRYHGLKPPEFSGFEILDQPTRSLVMNVRVHESYSVLARGIEDRMRSKCTVLETSPMDRIHLAYNILKSISRQVLKEMKDEAEKTIELYDWLKTGGSWRLVLYEVMLESQQVVGVQHQLSEIKSWSILSNSNDSRRLLPPSSFLPVSLRIKVSFLSSWFRESISPFSSARKILDNTRQSPPLIQNDTTSKTIGL
ncbi:MAG: hypothetical protein EXX96DRAFT_544935 [Benjaminiella poitrasii]|nr:MAG: hypothetical protein EXX96DRAFT_544935 [Benjaminiella poitrasii]